MGYMGLSVNEWLTGMLQNITFFCQNISSPTKFLQQSTYSFSVQETKNQQIINHVNMGKTEHVGLQQQ